MKKSDFTYEFSQDQIAIKPAAERPESRLMVVDRKNDLTTLTTFRGLSHFLKAGDLLVVNSTRVLEARFKAKRLSGGDLEGLFLASQKSNHSVVWLKGKVNVGEEIELRDGLRVKVLERDGRRALLDISPEDFRNYAKASGFMPLPPYIRERRKKEGLPENFPEDSERYQSLFSNAALAESAAAPTASLHFDHVLMNELKEKGINFVSIELQVSEATFEPIDVENLDQHEMHTERVRISLDSWNIIKTARAEGRRVIAVGTTALRSLESAALREEANLAIEDFETNLFVKPGYTFKIVDGLITNFHWPESTLLVLVATFLEPQSIELKEKWKQCYQLAVAEKMRLFSYGDAMLIL